MTIQELESILKKPEDYNLECKDKAQFSEKELAEYCAALANEGGGGYLIHGIKNKTHEVLGTKLYDGTLNAYPNKLLNRLGIRVDAYEILHPDGRVIVFGVSPRPRGRPIPANGKYLMRSGGSLVPMDPETLKKIFAETDPDYSSKILPDCFLDDLDRDALAIFKKLRAEKVGNPSLELSSTEQVLSDVGLIKDNKITFACLILLGKPEIIAKFVPQAETIYEWRESPTQIHYSDRKAWRGPYFKIYDEIWQTINQRNLRIPYQEGFVQREVLAYNKESCREAVNNAVAHRDYSIVGQSIFIRVSPEMFAVESPGGLLPGGYY